jgi:hypothetical protein
MTQVRQKTVYLQYSTRQEIGNSGPGGGGGGGGDHSGGPVILIIMDNLNVSPSQILLCIHIRSSSTAAEQQQHRVCVKPHHVAKVAMPAVSAAAAYRLKAGLSQAEIKEPETDCTAPVNWCRDCPCCCAGCARSYTGHHPHAMCSIR